MPVKMEKPNPTLPPNFRPANAFAYRVKNGDSFVSLANRLGITPKALLMFNFNTDCPTYVNYYLHHNVGCNLPSEDGKNYSFTNANPGVIYYPAFYPAMWFGAKEAGPDPSSEFGGRALHDLVIYDDPKDPTNSIRVSTVFNMSFILKAGILDPSRFVYRQYIMGRNRVQREDDRWIDIPVPVPDSTASVGTAGTFRKWSASDWHEDGAAENCVVAKYGYREAPYTDHDHYNPTQKNGAHYEMYDIPGFDVPKEHLREYMITRTGRRVQVPFEDGTHYPRRIESEYNFSFRLIELDESNKPLKIWTDLHLSFKKNWLITQRFPVKAVEY